MYEVIDFLNRLFNTVLESERMPEESKGKMAGTDFHKMGDVQSCSKKG